MRTTSTQYHVHYCPLGGLEYRCLRLVGWQVAHHLYVDNQPWVKMRKRVSLPRELLICLN